ncbi:MAG TPA: deoxyribodipyrimidine photolyase, partial [Cytophagales bacterium]|nr:deoxyribodipyrimidine photolyase [Cytophagales bacterium]
MSQTPITIFWMRRDLRLEDNSGLYYALRDAGPVLPIFIFDKVILEKLEDNDDARVNFLHQQIASLHEQLGKLGSTVVVKHGIPLEIFQQLLDEYHVKAIYTNRDYEPYAQERDTAVEGFCKEKGIEFLHFKDQVIFEKQEVKSDSSPFYKVFTPYKKKWLSKAAETSLQPLDTGPYLKNLYKTEPAPLPSLTDLGFSATNIELPKADFPEGIIKRYTEQRNFPAVRGTTRLGIHLRFGTISIRQAVQEAFRLNDTWLSELIWREFYMMILANNPSVVTKAFKPEYDAIPWRQAPDDFEKWCTGQTGYPIVDAGMRELKQTGFMHNRVRMVTASFLTKHLLIDWRWGEAWFARHLLDFELASNNGGWQWAAGSGTDAPPYF